jgi:hypothetical protein
MSFEEQEKRVKELKKEVYKFNYLHNQSKHKLKIELEKLQKMCIHNYIAEQNGDYHKPGYYYVCEKCDHFTMYNPFKK